MRRILVVNDDGIGAEGIVRLAAAAKNLGEVWVAAPRRQCSAMSHCITVRGSLQVRQEDFPVPGVMAYSVEGTPADCVKVGIRHLMQDRPDVVFSGINCGYNVGVDILYSGTVGAAMEALLNGIPAIAFSEELGGTGEAADAYLLPVAQKLLEADCAPDEIWNVNFPGCPLRELQGIRENRIPEKTQFYLDNYLVEEHPEGGLQLSVCGIPSKAAAPGTDMEAVLEHYISIGKIRNTVLGAKGRSNEPENALF